MADRWLEEELARQLKPVAAPQDLWQRINGQPRRTVARESRRVPFGWIFWPAAAAMVLVAAVGMVRIRNHASSEDRFTEKEVTLLAAHRGVDFRPASFDNARAWVRQRTAIDIAVPPGHPPVDDSAVQVMGVRLMEMRGLPIAAIDYKVGGETATLFVSGKRPGLTGDDMGPSLHLHSRRGLTYWNMRNETYTIAFTSATNPYGACILCHTTTPG
jgi:hypothetical protein